MWWVLANSFTASGSWEKDPAAMLIPLQPRSNSFISFGREEHGKGIGTP